MSEERRNYRRVKGCNDMKVPRDVFLSVIVAAYNVENYVKRCVDSILQTDFSSMEVIVVLGESSDQTNLICRDYEKKGLLACVIQDKKGLSNARNCGILRASGAYLTFVDADDRLETERFASCLQYLKKILQKENYDVIVNDFWFADDRSRRLFQSRQITALHRSDGYCRRRSDDVTGLVKSRGTFWNAWRYIYRVDYLKAMGRAFIEGCCCEDLEFAVKTLLDTDRVMLLHMPYYCYCPIRQDSLGNSKEMHMIKEFWAVERKLLALCSQKKTPLAQAMEEKLKELIVLRLPDLWEVDDGDRRAVYEGYCSLMKRMEMPKKRWVQITVRLCQKGYIVPVSYILYIVKYIRRKWKYRT